MMNKSPELETYANCIEIEASQSEEMEQSPRIRVYAQTEGDDDRMPFPQGSD